MDARTGSRGLSAEGRRDLSSLFSRGEVLVSVDRAVEVWGLTRGEAAKRLSAWAERGWLRRVRRGLYLAVPVEAGDPSGWTVDPWFLADVVWDPCYITGWSAANHWALTDQVFRSTVVATAQRVRRIHQELAGAPFVVHHVDSDLLGWGLRSEWRLGRRVRVASPDRALAEMLGSPDWGGGVRHVREVLETFFDEGDPQVLLEAIGRLGNGTAYKRLGYLTETLGVLRPEVVTACLENLPAGVTKLDPSAEARGSRLSRWGLFINVRVDE